MRELPELLAEAVWARVRSVLRAAQRLDRLPENPGGVAEVADAEAVAREFALRLLRAAAEPFNYAVLRRLAEQSSVPLVELAGAVGLPPLAVAERVADLIQVHLASRSLVGDQVQATAAASGVVGLVEAVTREAARRLAEEGVARSP